MSYMYIYVYSQPQVDYLLYMYIYVSSQPKVDHLVASPSASAAVPACICTGMCMRIHACRHNEMDRWIDG